MTQAFAAGKYGKATFGGQTVNLTSWSYEETGDDAEVTNSGTNGIKTVEPVTNQYSGSCEGVWDLNAQPTSNPPRIRRGTKGTLNLYLTPETYVGAFNVVVLGLTINDTQNDVVRYTFNWQATAAPTYPAAYTPSSSSSSSSST